MIGEIVLAVRRHLRIVMGIPAAVGGAVLVVGLLTPRSYEGKVVVSPVTSALDASGASLAASVLGGVSLGGIRSTATLVSRLARLDGVLFKVAMEQVNDSGLRVVDRLKGKGAGRVSDRDALAEMRKTVTSAADSKSGLVAITVTAKDSALVRLISEKLLAYTSAAFVDAVRAQASALKHAQDSRVANARLELSRAEDALLKWRQANRSSNQFSVASLTQRRLERELSVAEQLYTQVVTQREAAASQELEETPALVVVDGLPDRLRTESRGLAALTALWTAFSFLAVMMVLLSWPALMRQVRQSL